MSKSIFLRTATGLVKPWSAWDGFIYNVLAIQPMVVLAFGFVNGLAIAPAGDMWLALILTGIFCTALAYVEAAMISSMPRSGGDYIFQSRILGGALGYINLFVFVIIMQTIWLAFPAWWAADHVVAPFFVIFGAMWNNKALIDAGVWMSTGHGFFVLGVIVVAWSSIINYVGMVWYRRAQKVCFYVGMVGMLIMIVMLATTTTGVFQRAFDRFMVDVFALPPDMYNSIVQTASAEGFTTAGNVGYESLIIAIPLAMAFMFPAWSAFNAGEIKGAGGFKSQIFQVVVAEIVSIVLALALYTGVAHTVGDLWYKNITWLFWNTDAYTIPIAPYFGFLVAMIYENPIPMLIIFITLQAWFWMWYVNITLAVSRTLLAMSFDRVLPEKLADVHPRTRAPWVAIIVIMVFAWIFVALFAYTSFGDLILAAPLVSIIGFAGTALAALVMPWRRKELYKGSPISKYEIGGIPTLSIAGLIWIIFTIIVIYIFATEPRIFFVEGWIAWAYLIGMYVVSAIFYYGYKAYRKSQGIDVSRAYKEIPVE